MSGTQYKGPVNTNQSSYDAVINKLLTDPSTTGIKGRLDWLGLFANDFKAQWNAVNPGNPITVKDYKPTDYK